MNPLSWGLSCVCQWDFSAGSGWGRLRRAGSGASPTLRLLPVIPDPSWGSLCSQCFTAIPEGSWSPRVWHPLIRGPGGWGAAGGFPRPWAASRESQPRASTRTQARPWLMELSRVDFCCDLSSRSQAAGVGTRRWPRG